MQGANCHMKCLEVGWRGGKTLFLFNRLEGWESHLATAKHLGTIVHSTEGTANMRLGNLNIPGTLGRFLDVRRKDLWPPYSF